MNDNHDTSQPTPTDAKVEEAPTTAAVDVQKLAERVYNLMREELRLERARGINRNSFRRN